MKTQVKTASTQAKAIEATAAPVIQILALPINGKSIEIPVAAITTKLHKLKSEVGRLASKAQALPQDEIGGQAIVKFDLTLATTEKPARIITAMLKRGMIDKAKAKELREGFALVAALMTV